MGKVRLRIVTFRGCKSLIDVRPDSAFCAAHLFTLPVGGSVSIRSTSQGPRPSFVGYRHLESFDRGILVSIAPLNAYYARPT